MKTNKQTKTPVVFCFCYKPGHSMVSAWCSTCSSSHGAYSQKKKKKKSLSLIVTARFERRLNGNTARHVETPILQTKVAFTPGIDIGKAFAPGVLKRLL